MKKTTIMALLAVIIVLGAAYLLFMNHTNQPAAVEFNNDKYGFSLNLEQKFSDNVQMIEENQIIYFISKEIQAVHPGIMIGIVGRIEAYDKDEFTKETMLQSGDSYGLKYLGENNRYYFGWAHATDVQVPPGNESLNDTFHLLEKDFDIIIKTFKAFDIAEKTPPEMVTVNGEYVGLADNNFFEAKIKETPRGYMVFMITDEVRAKFESLDLEEGDAIKLKYFENEYGQNPLIEIDKLAE